MDNRKQQIEIALIHGYINLCMITYEGMTLPLNRDDVDNHLYGVPPRISKLRPKSTHIEKVPTYTNDLNEIRLVETHLITIHKFDDYVFALNKILFRDSELHPESCSHVYNTVYASALQKCEAILRTMGKWEE